MPLVLGRYVLASQNNYIHRAWLLATRINSQNQSIEAEIIGSTEVFKHPFASFILVPIDRKAAGRLGLTGSYFAI